MPTPFQALARTVPGEAGLEERGSVPNALGCGVCHSSGGNYTSQDKRLLSTQVMDDDLKSWLSNGNLGGGHFN